MRGPRELKFDAEVSQFWNAVNKAFDEHDIETWHGSRSTRRWPLSWSGTGPPPAHWMRSTHELEAAVQRERDAVERERAQAELLRQGAQRREAERRQEEREWHEEAQQQIAAERRKGAERREKMERETAAFQVRWAAAEKTAAEQGLDLRTMSREDLHRFLGSEAPLEDYET